MIGFIIIVVVALLGLGVYLVVRGGAKAAHVDLDDHRDGPAVPETEAAARHRARVASQRRRNR